MAPLAPMAVDGLEPTAAEALEVSGSISAGLMKRGRSVSAWSLKVAGPGRFRMVTVVGERAGLCCTRRVRILNAVVGGRDSAPLGPATSIAPDRRGRNIEGLVTGDLRGVRADGQILSRMLTYD